MDRRTPHHAFVRGLPALATVALLVLLAAPPALAAAPPGTDAAPSADASAVASGYQELVSLFELWRQLERPSMVDGVPDYSPPALAAQRTGLDALRARLDAIDRRGWSVAQRVDWHLVRAEMNGLDFNLRVLRPWARDPAFYNSVWTYQSDTPAHEGPTHHALV